MPIGAPTKDMRMRTDGRIVCFGELLIRLAAPSGELMLQTPQLNVCFGGAEANVAVSLARLGHDVAMASVAPGNALGRAACEELRRYGVDVAQVRAGAGRMGLYFLTPGAGHRAPQVLYDRADSAFARAVDFDFTAAFSGAGWLHLSGITPALGANTAALALRAVREARAAGMTVSFDCNYRAQLWEQWKGDGPKVLAEILCETDLIFGDHRDVALILGRAVEGEGPEARRRAGADAAFAAFPNLKLMACTQRDEHSAGSHDLSGWLYAREGAWRTPPMALTEIVDRVGGGDAFAAGVIHGLRRGLGEEQLLRFALAAAALKHVTPGDFNLARVEDVEAVLAGGVSIRR